MGFVWASILCMLYISLCYGSPTPPISTPQSPTPPSQDPFYSLSPGYETKRPGEILHHRPLPYQMKDPLPLFYEKGYQIVYRSTDSFDQPTATLATLLVPPDADFTKLFIHYPTVNSAAINCAPSYMLADGVNLTETSDRLVAFGNTIAITGALNQAWVVMMLDHEGFNAAFMANRRGAFAGLDGVRAALASSDFTGVSREAVAVFFGYSGASSPAVMAAEHQERYAPELNIAGVAAGGLLPNLQTVLGLAIDAPNNLPAALWGLANEYPEINSIVEEHLVTDDPVKRAEFLDARNQCAGALKVNFGTANMSTYFDDLDFMNSSTVQGILTENSLGHDVPSMPMLIYESTHDNKATIPQMDGFVSRYCEAGVSVDYRKYEVESHTVLGADGVYGALAWAKARFDGVSTGKECVISTHQSPVGPDWEAFKPQALGVWMDRQLFSALSETI